jgi:hypothetical protein
MKFPRRAIARLLRAPQGAWLLAVFLGLLTSLPASADSWTNRAGRALTARLLAIEGEQVVLQNTNGRTWRLALASLNSADQQRARAQVGSEPLPSELKACLNQAKEDIQRAAQFLQGGKITREEYATRCQRIKQRFEQLVLAVFKDRGEPLNHPLLVRLNQRLDQTISEINAPRQARFRPN